MILFTVRYAILMNFGVHIKGAILKAMFTLGSSWIKYKVKFQLMELSMRQPAQA